MLLVLAFAWTYVRYGATPQAAALLYGIKPVIIAVIVEAIYALLRPAVKNWRLGLAAAAALSLYLLGQNPLIPLFGLSLLVMLVENRGRLPSGARAGGAGRGGHIVLVLPAAPGAADVLAHAGGPIAAGAAGFSLAALFLTFLKIGATLSWQLGATSLVDPFTAALALAAAGLLIRSRVNSAWLVLGGAVAGAAYRLALG